MEEDLDRNTQVALFLTLVAFGLAVVVGTASTLVVPFLYKGLNRPARPSLTSFSSCVRG